MTKQSKFVTLTFSEDALPTTVAEVKEKIENDFSIPVCVQSLKYEDHILADDSSLEMAKIRSGT